MSTTTAPLKPHTPQIYLNLPVSSFHASVRFYTALGFVPNPHFAEPDTTIMMSLPPLSPGSPHPTNPSDNQVGTINIMVMTQERFKSFLPQSAAHKREIADVRKTAQALFCLSVGEKKEVDGWVERAVEAGGVGDVCKSGQEGGEEGKGEGQGQRECAMYGRSFEDLDGHIWELVWMNPNMSAEEIKASGEKSLEK